MSGRRNAAPDYTKNGECSNCGRCCGNILPLSDDDINAIRRHIAKHGVKACRHIPPLAYQAEDMTCPFRDDAKRICVIYEARPMICREFRCDYPGRGIHLSDQLKDPEKYHLRNVRETFFADGQGERK